MACLDLPWTMVWAVALSEVAVLVRKSFATGPMRWTVSRSGVSVSMGTKWGRIGRSPDRSWWSVRAPGSGASVRRSRSTHGRG